MSDPATPQNNGWLSWSYWTNSRSSRISKKALEGVAAPTHDSAPGPSKIADKITEEVRHADSSENELSGWERIVSLYNRESMEIDVVQRVCRMTFLGGFLMGGATGYMQARQTYEINNVGRKYLSPSDAVKRRMDYAIVRFAKGGFGMGFKCALISGTIVVLSTHLAAYRQQFSSWYFPAISGALAVGLHSVGGVFAFPVGAMGAVRACGLGLTSGLTLSAVVHLYGLSIDKPVNEAYWMFKREYEKELHTASEWDARVKSLMEQEGIRWRQTAVKRLKQADEASLTNQDA